MPQTTVPAATLSTIPENPIDTSTVIATPIPSLSTRLVATLFHTPIFLKERLARFLGAKPATLQPPSLMEPVKTEPPLSFTHRLEVLQKRIPEIWNLVDHKQKEEAEGLLREQIIQLARDIQNQDELLLFLNTNPFKHFSFGGKNSGLRPALRRAVSKYWREGTLLPWGNGIFLSDLFKLDGSTGELDDIDRRWIKKNIGENQPQEKAWKLLTTKKLSFDERVLIAMVLLEIKSGYGMLKIAFPPSDLKEYIERRAREGTFDSVDLLILSTFAEKNSVSIDRYSRTVQETLVNTALGATPMGDYFGAESVLFPLLYEERNFSKLPKDLQWTMIHGLVQNFIRSNTSRADSILNTHMTEHLDPDQIKTLLDLYEATPETTILHAHQYIMLLKQLSGVQAVEPRRLRRLPTLVGPGYLPQHASEMKAILEYLGSYWEKKWTRENAETLLPHLLETSDAAHRLLEANHCDHADQLTTTIWQVFQILSSWEKLYGAEFLKPAIPHAEKWLHGSHQQYHMLLRLFETVVPFIEYQTQALRITQRLFDLHTRYHPSVNGESPPKKLLEALFLRMDPNEKERLFKTLAVAYFSDPFSDAAHQQKQLLELNGPLPSLEALEGLARVLEHSSLDPNVLAKIKSLSLNSPHPLASSQILAIIFHVVLDSQEAEKRKFLERMTQGIPERGSMLEWVLLYRDLDLLPQNVQAEFVTEQNRRYEAIKNKTHFNPAKIRHTLKTWVRERFVRVIGLSPKEIAHFQLHTKKYPDAWSRHNFLAHLSAMSTFADTKGLAAIRELVVKLVQTPVDKNGDFTWAFRYRGMQKIFGDTFMARWPKERRYTVHTGEEESTLVARERFLKKIGADLKEHWTLPKENKIYFSALTQDVREITDALTLGEKPNEEIVERTMQFFKDHPKEMEDTTLSALREIRNDLIQWRRGQNSSFKNAANEEVLITGDPRYLVIAGLIGKKSCTRPTDPAPGNKSGQPAGRALHGPLLIAIYMKDGIETARSLIEVTKTEDGVHYTIEPLYEEGGFNRAQAFADILLTDAALLEIEADRVHNAFTKQNMQEPPPLLPSRNPQYNDAFRRPNAPANYSFS
ncbi:MAG: hypothetical protein Q7T03_10760 [Deltaproteobacteria bacterium]|nr:hypothetical protein [Deltaproteobacteria bacterium]